MSDRCMEFKEMSPGGREIVTSGGEREERRAWTHDKELQKVLQFSVEFECHWDFHWNCNTTFRRYAMYLTIRKIHKKASK